MAGSGAIENLHEEELDAVLILGSKGSNLQLPV